MGYNNAVVDSWKAIVTARGGTPTTPADYTFNDLQLHLLQQAIVAGGGVVPGRGDRDWNARHLQLLNTFSGLAGGGVTPLGMTFTDLISSGTWVDPGGNHLSGTPTFSSGWTVSLLGGAGTSASDPFSGAHLIGPAITTLADGTALTVAHAWQMLVHLLEVTPPDLSSDIRVAAGFCSEDADSSTIEAVFIMLGYGTATRAAGKGRVLNGAASLSFGTSNVGIRAFTSPIVKVGNSTNAHGTMISTARALDVAGDVIVGIHAGTGSDPSIVTGNWTPRPFVAAFRSSTSDGTTRLVKFRARRALLTAQPIPTS